MLCIWMQSDNNALNNKKTCVCESQSAIHTVYIYKLFKIYRTNIQSCFRNVLVDENYHLAFYQKKLFIFLKLQKLPNFLN